MIPTSTLTRFIRQEERSHPGSTGELSDLLTSIGLGVKIISQLVATAGFKGLYGYTGKKNVQGEHTQILDEEADHILVELLSSSGHFGLIVSEERDSVIATEVGHVDASYVVAFDPLDGSSNIGSNIPVGTVFSIFKKKEKGRAASHDDFMQPGRTVVAAGYAVYGAKTSFVYSCGRGVHGFTLDPQIGEFILTEESIRIPPKGAIYSTNEGNFAKWGKPIQTFVNTLKSENKEIGAPYSARYVGSLVVDFDRNLRKGGIFIYPPDDRYKDGKLRLLYECIPLAYIAEAAGGKATNGKIPILDILPTDIHQRSSFYAGSTFEMDLLEKALSSS